MTSLADHPARLWLRQLVDELRPVTGRAATTWRVALTAALVATAAMMFENPDAAVSCYLIILLMKSDGAQNVITAMLLTVIITAIITSLVFLTRWTVGSTAFALAMMAGTSFVLLYLGAASRLGEGGGILALIIAVVLSLVLKAPSGDIVTGALRYTWEMVALPMAIMAGCNLVFGLSPVHLLRGTLRHRLVMAREAILGSVAALGELRHLLREGNGAVEERAGLVSRLNLAPGTASRQMESDAVASYQLMMGVMGLDQEARRAHGPAIADDLSAHIAALDAGRIPPMAPEPSAGKSGAALAIFESLAMMAGGANPSLTPPPKQPFLAADAFINPAYQHRALKTTAAAMFCYVFYASLDWQGIHTAMITCYVVALSTTGETTRKLALRIGGCLVGAGMGWASILFLMPHLDSIGHLLLLVFAGTCVAVWVSNGSERISYAGVQIGLAFYLSILQGFGPSLDLETARDRIIGVLVGNTAIYVVSTVIWPMQTESALRASLSSALRRLADLAAAPPELRRRQRTLVAGIEQTIGRAATYLELLPFDPPRLRPSRQVERDLRRAVADIERSTLSIALSDRDLSSAAPELAAAALSILDSETTSPAECLGRVEHLTRGDEP